MVGVLLLLLAGACMTCHAHTCGFEKMEGRIIWGGCGFHYSTKAAAHKQCGPATLSKVWEKRGQGFCRNSTGQNVKYDDTAGDSYISFTRNGGGSDDTLQDCFNHCTSDPVGCVAIVRDSSDGECIRYKTTWPQAEGGSGSWECWNYLEKPARLYVGTYNGGSSCGLTHGHTIYGCSETNAYYLSQSDRDAACATGRSDSTLSLTSWGWEASSSAPACILQDYKGVDAQGDMSRGFRWCQEHYSPNLYTGTSDLNACKLLSKKYGAEYFTYYPLGENGGKAGQCVIFHKGECRRLEANNDVSAQYGVTYKCQRPQYLLARNGNNTCPLGSTKITSASECATALATIPGYSGTMNPTNSADTVPSGCFMGAVGNGNYNPHPTGSGRVDNHKVCKSLPEAGVFGAPDNCEWTIYSDGSEVCSSGGFTWKREAANPSMCS